MYFRFSKMHTVTNTYILHLAVADECFLVGIPFLIATMSFGQWPFGMTMCKIYFTTTSINQITSSLFLMVLSADRYVAVCHPISSPRFRTGIIAKVVSLSVWLMSGEESSETTLSMVMSDGATRTPSSSKSHMAKFIFNK